MSIEAMKQALDCLQAAYNLQQIDDLIPPHAPVKQAVAALRQAIEKAEQEQPVAWGVNWGKAGEAPSVSIIKRLPDGRIEVLAVEYGPQREWVGLTDEEMHECAGEYPWTPTGLKCARAIEAKLREKNGGGR